MDQYYHGFMTVPWSEKYVQYTEILNNLKPSYKDIWKHCASWGQLVYSQIPL